MLRYLKTLKELRKDPEKNRERVEAIKKDIRDEICRNTPPEQSYGRKMSIRQALVELERDGIIQIYEDQWGEVQIRTTGGSS